MTATGAFIVFEGCEGSGKSTQAKGLAQTLASAGHETIATREPGGSPIGEKVRAILLDVGGAPLGPRAETLLFAAARADHVASIILPALERGAIVVCDRFVDSSLAYQGVGRGLGFASVGRVNGFATAGLVPDLTFILDIDPAEGLVRARGSGPLDRLESEPPAFHAAVRQAFLDIAAAEAERHCVLDATRDPQVIAADVEARVESLLAAKGISA